MCIRDSLTINGGKTSDSERPLTIGTVESVTKSCFNVFDKVLLGHLHHPFSIKDDIIDYSGSLLQYSFSEINQPKGYKRLVVQDKNELSTSFVQLKPLRELEVVEGEYDEVIQGHIQPKNKDNYIHFKLKNMSHISDPMIHLKQLFPNTLALSNITFENEGPLHQTQIQQQDDQTIIKQFYKMITDNEMTKYQEEKINNLITLVSNKEV